MIETNRTGLIASKPNLESDVLVDKLFDVASNSWVSSDNLSQVKLVESCGFSSVVKTNHNYLVLFRWKQHEPHPRHKRTHISNHKNLPQNQTLTTIPKEKKKR